MDTDIKLKPVKILLVEDNQAHSELAVEALKEAKMHVDMNIVETGEEALDYLHCRGDYNKATRPDLILLDLNLPGIDGRDVLVSIKGEPKLKTIPVVVLTTSDSQQDLLTSYERHANCYIKKPVDFNQFYQSISQLADFWFTLVKLP